jgi:ABC-type glycerol-3-phosphate transport system substrate-binding protein
MLPAIEASGINWGVMPVFQGNGPVETVEFVEYYSIFSAAEHPDQAWEVLQFFQGEDAERILAANRIAGMPTLKALARENAESIFGRDAGIWVQAMDFARTPYTIVNYEEAMSEYARRFDLVKLGEMPVDQAASEVAEAVNRLIAENQS